MLRSNLNKNSKIIVVKVGTSVITNSSGLVAVGRVGSIVEQISKIQRSGKKILLISSGSVGIGRKILQDCNEIQARCNNKTNNFNETILADKMYNDTNTAEQNNKACAALGQSGLMSLYSKLFKLQNIVCAQVLVTEHDLQNGKRRDNVRIVLNKLLNSGIVPILNENDVVSIRNIPIRDEQSRIFWDNDSLAALVAPEIKADLVVLLTDVDGLYKGYHKVKYPQMSTVMSHKEQHTEPNKLGKIVNTYDSKTSSEYNFNGKSRVGRGGMEAKVDAALMCLKRNIPAVVIANGKIPNILHNILMGEKIGTLFIPDPISQLKEDIGLKSNICAIVDKVRSSSINVSCQQYEMRIKVLKGLADLLESNMELILKANKIDQSLYFRNNYNPTDEQNALFSRLIITKSKINTLIHGIKTITLNKDPINNIISKTKVSDSLILTKQSVPIGVLLIIFESRPDVLIQISSLAILTGNGLLLKGGSDALYTNKILYNLVKKALAAVLNDDKLIHLIDNRADIRQLLTLHKKIDLVIPRGSGKLVKYIKNNTKIPVLGHADGICHIYIDSDADITKALNILIDSKTDYPAACNSVETLLVNINLIGKPLIKLICSIIKLIKIRPSRKTIQLIQSNVHLKELLDNRSTQDDFMTEYGCNTLTLHIVESLDSAINHINKYGSGHTDAIITENKDNANKFINMVDSSSVFHNASTRFADGYRYGLGAEVGISTNKIHSRGPVGIDGLLTTKWVLRSSDSDIVGEYSAGKKNYIHSKL